MNEVRWLNRRSFLGSENAVCPRSEKIRRPANASHKTAVRYIGREGDPHRRPGRDCTAANFANRVGCLRDLWETMRFAEPANSGARIAISTNAREQS